MANQIKTTAVLSNLSEGEKSIYRLVVKNAHKTTESEFLQLVAEKAGQDIVQSRFWLDTIRTCLYSELAQNHSIDLGFLFGKLYVTGSLSSANEQPTKAGNPVIARIVAKGDLASKVAALEVVNDTATVAAVLYEVQQDNVAEANRIESTEERIVINGSLIKLDAASEENGVWLENVTTGIRVATATIDYSDSSTCYCKFATLPATGRYKLVVATRNGEDADVYALTKLTRYVYVVND